VKRPLGIFNNRFRGYAPENRMQLMKMLGIADEKHEIALQRIQNHVARKNPPVEDRRLSLEPFTEP